MRGTVFLYILFFLFSCGNETEKNSKTNIKDKNEDHLFSLLPSSHTGIDFVQTITEEYRYNFSQDPNIFNGGGVAVLDVDKDGLQDLFFTSRLQPCKLYLNQGDLHFKDISEQAGISEYIGIKTGVSVVDINMDGWQDIYVCRTFLSPIPERRNLLFINNKDNTFSEKAAAYGLDDLSPSQHAHFFDYDLDGDLDCYVLNHPVAYSQINTIDFRPSANAPYAGMRPPLDKYESDKLYRNDGNIFKDISKEAGIHNRAWGLSLMSHDFNDDGYPDLYIANDFIMPDFLYINNGDGTFTDKNQKYFEHITNHSMGIEIADLNNDGLAEITALDMLAEDWERRHRQLTTMQLERHKQLKKNGYGDQQMRNTLQLNNGKNHFSEIACLAGMYATEWGWAPLAADFDNDGWKDLFITNGVRRDLNDIDFFSYTADSINRTGGINESRFKTFQEFSNLMPSEKMANKMYRNVGQLQMKDETNAWGFSDLTFSNGAAYSDLDNDGDLDLIVHNIDDVPFIYKNNTESKNEKNWLQIKCRGTMGNPEGTGAKIYIYENDKLLAYHEMSPVRGFYSSVEPVFQVGLNNSDNVDLIKIIWPGGATQLLKNIKANQRILLDVKNTSEIPDKTKKEGIPYFEKIAEDLFKHVENEYEDFNRERLLPHRFSRLGPAMTVADLNGDGRDDFFIGGAIGQAGSIFIQNNEGKFSKKSQNAFDIDAGHEDVGALFFDVEGDGDADLYVVSGGNEWLANDLMYEDRLYINDGNSNFSKTYNLPKINSSAKAIVSHDLDGDSDLDLIIGGRVEPGRFPQSPESYILKNENGTFINATADIYPAFKNIGMITDLQIADIDQDGTEELIVAGEWMPIHIFGINKQNSNLTLIEKISSSSGWWNDLETADMDNDGDLDIIAGNLGLNTRFDAPLYLYASDFDNNGSMDPVLCVEENGKQLPLPMRDELIKQLPYLKKKYVRNTSYAMASVQQVFSKKELESSLKLKTDILATSWIENDRGNWKIHALPDEAQISPVHGILAEDFNGDGNIDLLLVGNDSGFDAETGPLDTSPGCFFLGDGKGGLKSVAPLESGFWAIKEARGLFKIKEGISGKNLFLVPNNNDDLLIFSKK